MVGCQVFCFQNSPLEDIDTFKTEHDINIYQFSRKQVLSDDRVLRSVPRQPWRSIKQEKGNIN